ncbi:MAG: hypothetical protein A2741_00020 [Candidatus Zambryskibacteria bacterium RIFCSPHIGHO2_01_FULL_43_27]|uniref:Excinuclease ABC subunit C n=1 Tax=Candidatus Zambryskibacteria bacterium RIFCSPLOWO2_01_FULL_43_17 TaxID=1802760 RepID=A0A1G2U4I2_9BACT|nr:MAG: hypothetical protein A2741_00020 [Candidatus Zambryskibacteria bacterium RIFCSPHIGHO2_01_FULL_43_27]OHB00831.1 MAG: hypothetical protein A3E93_03210 [Candidatus Zambryskibacteria bacterium RIFCSPHIGHO2_12_FULL_43_12b]OHB04391.1 MAG: hypothetical protein A2920_02100 [Candidatus Zambryskibacteria bacterium RIFCSPLOWO2_01_FULL_43_17]
MTSQDFKKQKLPDSPGIYFFKTGKDVLYVGKATSIRERVKSYFSKDLIDTRGPLLVKMLHEADTIYFEHTDSVLEALILETNYIKKLQPFYNSISKDDKSYNYVVITKEKFPVISTIRGHELQLKSPSAQAGKSLKLKASFGPFPHGAQLKEALKIVRRIFPYRDAKCKPESGKPCFNFQIGLCPGVCIGEMNAKDYQKMIRNIILFFQGKKSMIIKNLEKEMKILAKSREFEKANFVKRQIFALNHIQDVALLKNHKLVSESQKHFRIEAFDIAHLSGKDTVGVMVVIEDGELNKNEYRKFKVRGVRGEIGIDDTRNLREILSRRFAHNEWRMPDMIVVDGGVAQKTLAKKILDGLEQNIGVVSVIKDEKHRPRKLLGGKKDINIHKREILLANSEAHRFAISYHKNLRNRMFRGLK